LPREWVPDFLAALALSPNVALACRTAGVSRVTAYDLRHADAAFAAAWQEAVDESTDELVGEMYRRAKDGVPEPVYYKGEVCGHILRYSNTLAIFLAKAHRPGVYGDKLRADVNVTGETVAFYLPANGRDDDDPGP